MQALGRAVSEDVADHFAMLLKQRDGSDSSDEPIFKTSFENVVRPAAFQKESDVRATLVRLDVVETRVQRNEDHAASASLRSDTRTIIDAVTTNEELQRDGSEAGDPKRTEFSSVLEKIEAAGASMRLAEERANRQSAWTQEFVAATRTRLKDAESLVQETEVRREQLEKRSETAELALEAAEQRYRTAEARLEAAEKRLEAAETNVQAALELARRAEARCAEAVTRAADAERWMQDILHTVAKEFPVAQLT